MNSKQIFKLIVVGNSGVGKSCIILRYLDDEFNLGYEATIGVEFGSVPIELMGKSVVLQIWDTAGQETYRSITKPYFRRAVGALIVYDITDRNSFNSVMDWLEDVQLNASPNTFITIVGNKRDLESKRQVSYEEGVKFAKENGFLFFETSAQSSYNIEKIFEETANKIYQQIQKGDIQLSFDEQKITINEYSESEEEKLYIKNFDDELKKKSLGVVKFQL
ncbi:rab2a [Anaeramoeba flamelloides]|uniref:Rab2a n=1 Tax=Anaeramoeba flamelloides TaxID=1746091 RepID=A0ABQ8XYA5_9EUKA|nr:rab2a [Anaeramoeba flamelloides]